MNRKWFVNIVLFLLILTAMPSWGQVSPVSDFDCEVSRDSCRFKVQLHNRSHHSDDTTQLCTWWKWIFENGDTSLVNDTVLYWSDTLSHTITLVSGLGDGNYDTLTRALAFSLAHDTTWAAICMGTAYPFCDSLFYTAGQYDMQLNCDSIRTLLLTVYETYDTIDTIFVCKGNPYVYRGVDYGGPTDIDTNLHTQRQCDSIVHVSLVTADPEFVLSDYYSFDNTHWADSIPIKGCAPSKLFLRDTTPCAATWQWTLTIGDTASSMSVAPNPTFSFDDSTTQASISLQVQSVHGCRDSLEWPVVVFPSPEADFGWTPEMPVDVVPEALFYSLAQPEDCDYYRWFFQHESGSTDFDTLEGKQTHYRWGDDLPVGDFDVRMVAYRVFHYDTIVHTCSDTSQQTVTIVTALLQFPNLVTPDGDGVNDVWDVVNLVDKGLYAMNELWIFDSWGAVVYHVKNIKSHDQAWDPIDTRSPDGTYFFRFVAKNQFGIIRRNGMIEVIRQQ